jgi:hypothetical protein
LQKELLKLRAEQAKHVILSPNKHCEALIKPPEGFLWFKGWDHRWVLHTTLIYSVVAHIKCEVASKHCDSLNKTPNVAAVWDHGRWSIACFFAHIVVLTLET